MTVSVVPVCAGEPARARRQAHAQERGDIIASWLIKVTISLALAGLAAFDGISIATAQMSITDDAAGAARAAVDAVDVGGDYREAHPAAVSYVLEQDATNVVALDDVLVDVDGSAAVTVHRTAPTLILFRLGPIAHWADRSATIIARPLP